MTSPDLVTYVDLSFFDLGPDELRDRAVTLAQTSLPEWNARPGSVEMTLNEAWALLVAELLYAMNRVASTVTQELMGRFGVTRSYGTPATATVTFNLADSAGHDIPAGTVVRLTLGGEFDPVDFTTDALATANVGTSAVTTAVTATVNGTAVNGAAVGTALEVISALSFVNGATLATSPGNGTDPEDDTTFLNRAVQRLSRLVTTLVSPEHFENAALENTAVYRAKGLDDYTPATLTTPTGVTATPATTGGTLAAGTYSYRVAAVNQYGQTVASAAVTAVTTGTTGSVALAWDAVQAADGAAPVTGYRVYGRVGGAEGLLTTVTAATYTDTGADAVGAAPPATDSTGGPVGDFPGHMTVAVLGPAGALVPAATKTALQTDLDGKAQANLGVHVTDPTITAVPVTLTVHPLAGFTAAQVQANVTAALQAYLSPDSWLWSATVRVNELISIADQAAGVDYVTSIDAPTADVALTGAAPLASAGAIAVTVA